MGTTLRSPQSQFGAEDGCRSIVFAYRQLVSNNQGDLLLPALRAQGSRTSSPTVQNRMNRNENQTWTFTIGDGIVPPVIKPHSGAANERNAFTGVMYTDQNTLIPNRLREQSGARRGLSFPRSNHQCR